ncbi:choice-of-anchor M domain-containing protein [Agromyces aerolatus]|uniref:choice-of-anchor M domain-containing protein n=1 Tax=Agromyces sp. LY-1074 TaxID=3074080 RepID=UPI0028620C52|nr:MULTISPECIES: choice-of-anchor M domain-containing protein [unclassified Agromyces]MDR5700860.1 choice-of-anchor M domain-containing protein [Agromyces sp. LY-1074]MDR5707479.1 choice-of-anchor M domain-containing protein [Agromyces sp. LY-1358]
MTGALLAPSPAFAAEPIDDPIRFDHGHIDAFALSLNDDGSVRLALKEDVTGSHVERTPESVELFVKSQAIVDGVPAQYRPAGLQGAAYQLPLTQDPNLLWPGWDSQGIASAYGSNARIEIEITDVSGPGEVFLWSQGPFGDPRQILTGTWKLPATITQTAPAHVHSNWAFTEAGRYELTAQATVTSGDGTRTSTTNSADYTFIVAPAPTALTIEGAASTVEPGAELTLTAAQTPADATFSDFAWYTRANTDAEWQRITGASGSELTITAADGAQVRATVSGGQDVSASSPFVVESPPVTISAATEPAEPTVSIAPLAHHYHSGSPIDLIANTEPELADATYRWTVQRTDQTAPVALAETGATARLTAEQALTEASVRVAVLDADANVLAESDPVTIDVDDHGAAPLQKVSITGLAGHYHSGDTVSLTAAVDPASVLGRFEWTVQPQGETEPRLIAGEHDPAYEFEATEELAGAAIVARLTYDDGRPYAESAPAIVHLDDHGHVIPDTDLAIGTDRAADDYWVGQTARLTATQSTPTGLTEHRWSVKQPGADTFTVVDGLTAAEYSFKPTLENSGVQVKVELLHDGEVHAASEPVTITAQQRPVVTELLVEADQPSYVAGETAHLTSTQNPDSGIHHYHWYVKRAGASDFVWVDQSRDADLAYPVTLEDDGAQLVLRLFDETHAVIAESLPHTLSVTAAGTTPDPGDPAQLEPTPAPGGDGETPPAGDGAAAPAGDGSRAGSTALASTGAEISGIVVGGALLLLLGAASVLAARRRGAAQD